MTSNKGEGLKEEELSEMRLSELSLKRSGSRSDLFRRYRDTNKNEVKDRAKAAKVGPSHQRQRKVVGVLVAGLSALVIAGGIFMWNWDDGRLAQPLIEQINPTSALLFSDHLNADILTNQMKRMLRLR